MALHVANGFPQGAVGFHQMLVDLRVEPPFEPVHQRSALRLVIRQARLGAQLLLAGLLVVVEDRAEHLEDHLAFVRKHLCEVAELAPPMGQAVTPDQPSIHRPPHCSTAHPTSPAVCARPASRLSSSLWRFSPAWRRLE